MKVGFQEFWCSGCDTNLVNSEKPESGKFYEVFGHQLRNGTGDYHSVIFALCPNCKIEDTVKEVNVEELHMTV